MGIRTKQSTEQKIYVHYGSSAFDRDKFKKVKNDEYAVKPIGGLWGSPIDSATGWKQWCIENNFREINEDDSFYFRIRGWQVYEVETTQDLQKLPHIQMPEKYRKLFLWHEKMLDFEAIMRDELSYSALDIKIEKVSDELPGYDCDCIIVLDDYDLVINHDAKRYSKPLTLKDLLPMKWYKTVLDNIEVCGLLRTPENKIYIYTEQPDEHYFFKSMVACISDGRIVETCGYTEQEAKDILDEILNDADGILEMILENRKD